MRIRTLTLLTVLALVVAACGGSGAEDSTATSAADTTTTAPEPAVEAMQLSYQLEPGASYAYEVDMDQTIDMTTTGDTSALGGAEGEDIPGEMSLVISGTSLFTHTVAEGPQPGTFAVTITGDFSGMDFNGTVDGEPVESSEIPDMALMEPVDVTVIVDEQGNLIPDDQPGLGEDLLGDLGGLNMLDQFGAGGGLGQFIGPPFSEDQVTVGDTWSETVTVPTMPDTDPIITQIDSEVVGIETIGGSDVFVIDTTNSTSAIEFDLAQLLIGFMTAFTPEDMTEEEQAEIDAVVENLRFAISVDPQVAEMTTWFDFEQGLTRQAEMSGDTHLVMDINIPDESTGELVEFGMDMSVVQDVTYRLIGTGSGGDA
jgi:hypothetical protein